MSLVHTSAMNEVAPRIEIFTPFGQAFDLTKKILFQPFDLRKWCVIGFAAFLTYLNGGGFPGFHFPGNWANHTSSERQDFRSFISGLDPIWWVLIGVSILALLTIIVVLTWVRARGHFIFIDCIVRNRAAIAQPWREYRVEGNSYFFFSLLVMLAILGLIVLIALVVIVPAILLGSHGRQGLIVVPVLVFTVIFLLVVFCAMVIQFVAPVMYRRRCTAWPAFRDLLKLLGQHVGVFILYFLFSIVLGIAMVILILVATCATCCIAAIPYVGAVILLPVYVFMQSFSLLFLRQFGSDYDVWAGISEPPPRLPATPPPVQV
jgi:hypothetical protein